VGRMRQKNICQAVYLISRGPKTILCQKEKKNKRGINGFLGNCLGKKQLLNRSIQATHKKVASRYDMT
jgi:hypothetical protein